MPAIIPVTQANQGYKTSQGPVIATSPAHIPLQYCDISYCWTLLYVFMTIGCSNMTTGPHDKEHTNVLNMILEVPLIRGRVRVSVEPPLKNNQPIHIRNVPIVMKV